MPINWEVEVQCVFRITNVQSFTIVILRFPLSAPELLADEPAFPMTDVWSLGAITYLLLSGTSPFRGDTDAETRQNILFVRFRFEYLYREITTEATRFLMQIFKRAPR